MILQSLAGLPAFLVYFCTAIIAVVAYLLVYTRITPHNEFQLIRDNDPAAAIALGLSLLGFVLPVVSAIAHSANVVDCLIWSLIALIVQVVVYYLVKIPVPDLSKRIAEGQLAPAIWLGLASLAAGGAQRRLHDQLMTTSTRLTTEFGKRRPAPLPPAPGPKRSNHVALLVMGTLAVGGGAYALMPGESCQPTPPGMAAPATPQAVACTSRGGSGGSGGGYSRSSRFSLFGNTASSSPATETSGGVTRGGFGSFARAFGFGGG